jgi:aminopeptidase N
VKYIVFSFLLFAFSLNAQNFDRQDSLRGNLTHLRSCYDVTFYDLNIAIDEVERSIEQSTNIIHFDIIKQCSIIQVDLASNMEIMSIKFEGNELKFEREIDAVYVYFNRTLNKGESHKISVLYGGYPKVAKNPPWDGGFSWEKDFNGNPWIGVSCQGLGASTWWPCKDHQSDEPDSMRIKVAARYPLKIISNGNLRSDTTIWNQYFNSWMNVSEWFVTYPINNYNVTINIGDYNHISDQYISNTDTLELDYYILSGNELKAKEHFKQVKPMLECFENFFGPYPFLDDGYSLIETSYLGMEHQSAIAYGNNFLKGYYGNIAFTDNLDFDYIIVHESGHEWWGNSITTSDIADMWIHEGFCTYSEVLFVECLYGYDKMLSYVNNQKNNVLNDKPILGTYHVNNQGSSDMYCKGSLMLHTLRNLIDNDELWFSIIKGISNNFKYQIVEGIDIINYINLVSDKDFSIFFRQYLEFKDIPEFQYSIIKDGMNTTLVYRWEAIDKFDMPLLINIGQEDFWIYPSNSFSELDLGVFDINDFNIRTDLFYINTKKL